jgi:hypothetical protein
VVDGTGFGEYGGVIDFPSAAASGDVVWLDLMVYFGSEVDLDLMRADSKFLRVRTETSTPGANAGYLDVYLSSGSRSAYMFQSIKEGVFTWFPMGTWTDLTKDTWHRITLAARMDAVPASSGGTGYLKVWRNGALLLNAQNYQSLTGASDRATHFYCATQWNNGVTSDQAWYVDRLRVAKNGVPTWALDLEGVA